MALVAARQLWKSHLKFPDDKQIAAMADTQYLVSKSESSGRTFTQVTVLDEDGRKGEIARLFGGDHITDVTLAAASEQLAAAEQFKKKAKR